jgi:signal transduction histidine kinase
MEEIDLKEVVHHSLQLLKQELEKNSIAMQTDLPADQFTISGDFDQIEQVLINLLVNAIDAVRDNNDPHIFVEGADRNGLKLIRIRDNGKGIDEEEMEKVFIPFYTTKEHGSGIGLSLVRQILKMHKGEIQLFSRGGSGTTCEILFY